MDLLRGFDGAVLGMRPVAGCHQRLVGRPSASACSARAQIRRNRATPESHLVADRLGHEIGIEALAAAFRLAKESEIVVQRG